MGDFDMDIVPKTPSCARHTITNASIAEGKSSKKDAKSIRRKVQDFLNSASILRSLKEPEWEPYKHCPCTNLVEGAPVIEYPGKEWNPNDLPFELDSLFEMKAVDTPPNSHGFAVPAGAEQSNEFDFG